MRPSAAQGWVSHAIFDPQNRWLAVGDSAGKVRLWDLQAAPAHSAFISLPTSASGPTCLEFSADGRWLAAKCIVGASRSEHVRLFQMSTAGAAAETIDLTEFRTGGLLAFSADGRWLCRGGSNPGREPPALWKLPTIDGGQLSRIDLDGAVHSAQFSHRGSWLVAQLRLFEPAKHRNRTAETRVWNLVAEDSRRSYHIAPHDQYQRVLFSPNDEWLALSTTAKTELWALSPSKEATPPEPPRSELCGEALCFDAAGRWLATQSEDHAVHLWDLRAKDFAQARVVLRGHDTALGLGMFGPASRYLVTAPIASPSAAGSKARLWELEQTPKSTPVPMPGKFGAFQAGSKRFLATHDDRTIRAWVLDEESVAARNAVTLHLADGQSSAGNAQVVDPTGR